MKHLVPFLWTFIYFFTKSKKCICYVFYYSFSKHKSYRVIVLIILEKLFLSFWCFQNICQKCFKNSSKKNVVKTGKVFWKFLIVLLNVSHHYVLLLFCNVFLEFFRFQKRFCTCTVWQHLKYSQKSHCWPVVTHLY